METKYSNLAPEQRPVPIEEPAEGKENSTSRPKEEEDIYPVQQIAATEPITEKEVKDAVRELNPDCNSMDSRG